MHLVPGLLYPIELGEVHHAGLHPLLPLLFDASVSFGTRQGQNCFSPQGIKGGEPQEQARTVLLVWEWAAKRRCSPARDLNLDLEAPLNLGALVAA